MLAVLVQIDGYDPVTAATVSLFASNVDDPAVCMLNGATWWPTISKLGTLKYDLFDGSFAGSITSPSSSLTLHTEPWPNFGRYSLADARIRLWTGAVGAAWGSYVLQFDGRLTAQPTLLDGAASVAFATDDKWLDRPLLSLYAGTTGIEGPAALKGTAKPLALGTPRYVAGVLIDSVNCVFQVSAYGTIQAVEATMERLLRFGPAVGDFANYAALVAASIPAGRWGTCLAQGLVRFGAPTTGQVCFHVQGDTSGSDGWARKPGQLIRYIAKMAGGAGKIDDVSLNALDAARPYNLSIYLTEQTTARTLIQQIAASVNAVAIPTWLGKLAVVPIPAPGGTASVTLAADGSSLPPVTAVQQLDVAAPFSNISLTAERTYTVHQLADIAFTATLIDMGAYVAGTTYREGNIVQDQGSSWLYINPTPSAGNAPPTLPTTSNAYWKVLAKSGADGASPVVGFLTNEATTVPAAVDGTVSSYAGASGTFRVYAGLTDVSALFSLSTQANPQVLTVAYAGQGYTVSGGLDPSEDSALLTIRATGSGAYAGVTIDKVFSIGKSKTGANGAPAKLLTITSDRQTIAYDGAGNPTPATQTTTFTANKQNTTATVTWSITDANGVARTPVTTYLSASTGDSVTMIEAQFAAARNSTSGVIITGTLTDGSTLTDKISVVRVANGADGAAAINGLLTNETATVPADASGNVTSYSTATGAFRVFAGLSDVSPLFTLSTVSNPQALAVTYTSQTYTISGGLDAGEDTGTLTIRATGSGAYAGVTIDKVFSLGKSRTGAGGAPAKLLTVTSDRQTIAYDGAGNANPSTQTTTFTANKQNTSATVTWSVTDANGTARTPVTSYLSASTGDSVAMIEAQFAAARNGTSGVIVTGTLTDGTVLTDKISIVRVAAGAAGADGSNTAMVFLFQRNTSGAAPAVPAGTTTYTFATGVLSGTLGGWTQAAPDPTNGPFLFVTTAPAIAVGATDTIATGEWAAPRLLAQDGSMVEYRFLRQAGPPATPTGSNPSGWTTQPPSGTLTLWFVTGVKDAAGNLLGGWSTPQSLSATTPRGAYASGSTYYSGDLVTYNGGTYLCLVQTTGNAPSGTDQSNTWWAVWAAPGAAGTPATPPTPPTGTITIGATAGTVNLRSLANAAGYTGASNATYTFNVTGPVTGLSSGGIGIDTGTWPAGYTISLTLNIASGVAVTGGGGQGGSGGGSGWSGGDGIFVQQDITIVNSGVIQGGGGGGGSNAMASPYKIGTGGGGGGAPNGAGGAGSEGSITTGADGSPNGGAGGSPGGGGGGAIATAGSASSNGTPGGAPGYAIRRNGKSVSYSGSGTLNGANA
jgi:hypothetical protein